MAASEATTANGVGGHAAEGPPRRDFLTLVTLATAAIGACAVAWPFIDSMDPAADTIAAGSPVDVDLSHVQPGQQIVVLWREKPVLIVNRTPAALKTLQDKTMIDRLSDPNSKVDQQPPYAENGHRSVKPEYAVLVGICTHLGCLPGYWPNPSQTTPVADWPGGYLCPCHGSKYDLAGRVWKFVPAPYNLPVPPYNFVNDKTVRIGENPPNQSWTLNEVVQI